MAIYSIETERLVPLKERTFAAMGIRERQDLQRLLKQTISALEPGLEVIAEEFGDWEEGKRRIDLLAVDAEGNLVVIELKRTEDGGHMELQALRYAAMISNMTFDQAVECYARYLKVDEGKARERLLAALTDVEGDPEATFGESVRIILAAADFSKELTTSVLWLNQQGLDISCVRIKPYDRGNMQLIDIQRVIPLPEAQEFQVGVRTKAIAQRAARIQGRDLTRFDLTIGIQHFDALPKRWLIFHVVQEAVRRGASIDAIKQQMWHRNDAFVDFEGSLDERAFAARFSEERLSRGRENDIGRYFAGDGQLIISGGRTYAFTKMWGQRTTEVVDRLIQQFALAASYSPTTS